MAGKASVFSPRPIGIQRKVAFVDKLMAYKNSSKELLKETSHWALEKLTAS